MGMEEIATPGKDTGLAKTGHRGFWKLTVFTAGWFLSSVLSRGPVIKKLHQGDGGFGATKTFITDFIQIRFDF
jgi:hypothetical protein